MRHLNLIPILALTAALAGCTSPRIRYYTLVPPAAEAGSAPAASAGRYAISMQPVSLPSQVDRPQIVVSTSSSTQVMPLNESLWVSPLDDQIRRTLSADLSARLGVLDIPADTAPSSLPVWKIFVTVQRFDSVFGKDAILDATWRLQPLHQRAAAQSICRAEITVPVGAGVPALVAGQRAAVRTLSSLIAARISGAMPAASGEPGVVLKGCT